MEDPPKQESGQLPEDGPAEQVPDEGDAEARDDAEENPGVPDNPGQATGHPENAG